MELTNVVISKKGIVRDNILKGFGHKDLSHLQKKQIMNKKGYNQTVYTKSGQPEPTKQKKQVDTNSDEYKKIKNYRDRSYENNESPKGRELNIEQERQPLKKESKVENHLNENKIREHLDAILYHAVNAGSDIEEVEKKGTQSAFSELSKHYGEDKARDIIDRELSQEYDTTQDYENVWGNERAFKKDMWDNIENNLKDDNKSSENNKSSSKAQDIDKILSDLDDSGLQKTNPDLYKNIYKMLSKKLGSEDDYGDLDKKSDKEKDNIRPGGNSSLDKKDEGEKKKVKGGREDREKTYTPDELLKLQFEQQKQKAMKKKKSKNYKSSEDKYRNPKIRP